MRFPLWKVVKGPEWPRSYGEADPADGYFEDNVDAIREGLAHDPFAYARPLHERQDDVRVATSKEPIGGYRVVVLARVDRRARTVELGWVMVESLEEE